MKLSTPREWGGLLVLLALVLIGNHFNYPLFFGVDFLFGSVATLIIFALYGWRLALFSSFISAVHTYILWNHPYGGIALIGEVFFLELFYRRVGRNLAVVAGLYWAVIGNLAVWLFYRYALGMDSAPALLAALKQATNGILNAIIASLVLVHTPIAIYIGHRKKLAHQGDVLLSHWLFNLLVASAVIPILVFIVADARKIPLDIEKGIQSRLNTIGTGLSLSVTQWVEAHRRATISLRRTVEDFGYSEPEKLQRIVVDTKEPWSGMKAVYISDANGTAVAFAPPINSFGKPTRGTNFADREYFKETKETLKTNVSSVFMGRGAAIIPMVSVSSPVMINGKFSGIASSSASLDELREILSVVKDDPGYVATLVDQTGQVVVSTNSAMNPMDKYNFEYGALIDREDEGRYHRWPSEKNLSPMAQWYRSSLGREIDMQPAAPWKMYVEIPLSQMQKTLFEQSIRSLVLVLALAILVFLISRLISLSLTRPLSLLANETTNLPDRLRDNQKIQWPESSFLEFNQLVENFRSTTQQLKNRFADLDEANSKLKNDAIERERILAELKRSNHVKDEFLATLSHELRTPLNIIRGYIDLLFTEKISPEAIQYAEVALRNTDLLTTLIQDLLDASKIEAGKLMLEKSRIDLNKVVRDSLESVQLAANAKRIVLKTNIDGEGKFIVLGDSARLHQVLWNLLSNSIKFTPNGGVIEVALAIKDDSIELRVKDSGEGIAADFLPNVFNRFHQENGSTTRTHGGLGLGLFIVKQLVELHGGTIRAESEGKDRGSTMIVMLPHA